MALGVGRGGPHVHDAEIGADEGPEALASFDEILAKAKAEMDKAKADIKAEAEKAKKKK